MWCSRIRGLPENTPPALPPVARNSLVTVRFIRSNSCLSMIVPIDGVFDALVAGLRANAHGTSSSLPVVLRLSISAWAVAASAS